MTGASPVRTVGWMLLKRVAAPKVAIFKLVSGGAAEEMSVLGSEERKKGASGPREGQKSTSA